MNGMQREQARDDQRYEAISKQLFGDGEEQQNDRRVQQQVEKVKPEGDRPE